MGPGTKLGYPDGTTLLLAIVGTPLGVLGVVGSPCLRAPLGASVAMDEGTWVSFISFGLNEKVGHSPSLGYQSLGSPSSGPSGTDPARASDPP